MNVQFKKGALDLCVLSLLTRRDCYGYEINEYFSNKIDISEGTIYPILRKLKKNNLVTTYLKESDSGAPRKYYSITEEGENLYAKYKLEWYQFIAQIDQILKGDNEDEI